LLVSLLVSSVCFAEFRDPTKPSSYSVEAGTDPSESKQLKLSSIWISGSSKRVTINGVTAKQGDVILSSIKILKIATNSVLIKQNGQKRKLTLFTQSFKTQ
jgi:hypothetical protein